jgi:hypothetical protein
MFDAENVQLRMDSETIGEKPAPSRVMPPTWAKQRTETV